MKIRTRPNSTLRKLRYIFVSNSNVLYNLKVLLKKDKIGPKIFCIGYMKSGTSSFGLAMRKLGFDHSGFNAKIYREYQKGNYKKVYAYINKFDSFDDLPWMETSFISILDDKYPDSKFIYLERDEKEWKSSFKRWSEKLTDKKIDLEEWHSKFISHRLFVLNYFKDRIDKDFIILDISDPFGFSKLGKFLNMKTPQKKFPHINKT